MPLRDVLIKLKLDDSQYRAKIAAAAAQTRAFGAETAASGAKGARSLGLMSGAYTTVGLAAAATAIHAVKVAADFEQSMSNIDATGAATRGELEALRQEALEFGRTTTYSATEAAGGIEALLKAGVKARDVMGRRGGLAASLSLAAASNLDVEQSAEAVSIALQQFKLDGKNAAHVSDLLAAGAGKSVGEVSDLSMALAQSGLVAKSTGLSIEETTGALSAFASAGLIGSDAGTSFKTMLQRLAAPTAESAALMDRLGISAYDAQGKFVGLANFSGTLREALKGMSQEQRQSTLATIFGSDAVRAATILYDQGKGGVNKWTKAVNDAGYASEVAKKKTNNLNGDLKKLKSNLDTLFIEGAGGKKQGPIRDLINDLNDLVDAIRRVQKIANTDKGFWGGFWRTIGGGSAFHLAEGGAVGFAQGGYAVRGAGGPMQDSIPARLSNGEHVLSASDVRKAGGQDAIYAMRADIQAGRLRFAAGGSQAAFAQPAATSMPVGPLSVSISIRDVSFDVERSLASMRVVAFDAAGRVLRDQAFKADLAVG